MGGWHSKKPDESTDGLSPTEFYLLSFIFLLSREVSYLVSPMAIAKGSHMQFSTYLGLFVKEIGCG